MLARFIIALLAACFALALITAFQVYHLEQSMVTNRMLLEDMIRHEVNPGKLI